MKRWVAVNFFCLLCWSWSGGAIMWTLSLSWVNSERHNLRQLPMQSISMRTLCCAICECDDWIIHVKAMPELELKVSICFTIWFISKLKWIKMRELHYKDDKFEIRSWKSDKPTPMLKLIPTLLIIPIQSTIAHSFAIDLRSNSI